MFKNITGNKASSASKKGESQQCNFDQEGQKVDNVREKKKHVARHRALYSNNSQTNRKY